MKRLADVLAAYERIDRFLEDLRAQEDTAQPSRIEPQQILNDQAYFLLCWGQLEAEIDVRCRDTIRKAQQSTNWLQRRGWDIYNPDDKRLSGLPFEDRAAILLNRAAGRGSQYARAMAHYNTRNQIAHGRLQTTRVDVVAIGKEFYQIQAALT